MTSGLREMPKMRQIAFKPGLGTSENAQNVSNSEQTWPRDPFSPPPRRNAQKSSFGRPAKTPVKSYHLSLILDIFNNFVCRGPSRPFFGGPKNPRESQKCAKSRANLASGSLEMSKMRQIAIKASLGTSGNAKNAPNSDQTWPRDIRK